MSGLRHLRARSVPEFLLGIVVLAVLAWWAAEWLSSRPYFDGPSARPPVAGLAPLIAAALLSPTLAAADEELERSTARPWRWIRLWHVLAATAVAAGSLALTGLWEPRTYGAFELIRNTAACVGMVAVAAPLLGAKTAWAPAFGYVVTVYIAAPKPVEPHTAWWTWVVQPSTASLSWWIAGAWFVIGLLVYSRYGARAVADRDA